MPPNTNLPSEEELKNALSKPNDECLLLPNTDPVSTDCVKRYFICLSADNLNSYADVIQEAAHHFTHCYNANNAEEAIAFLTKAYGDDSLLMAEVNAKWLSLLFNEVVEQPRPNNPHCHTLFIFVPLPKSWFTEKFSKPSNHFPSWFQYVVLAQSSLERTEILLEENNNLKEENKVLKGENNNLKEENKVLKGENETLKEENMSLKMGYAHKEELEKRDKEKDALEAMHQEEMEHFNEKSPEPDNGHQPYEKQR